MNHQKEMRRRERALRVQAVAARKAVQRWKSWFNRLVLIIFVGLAELVAGYVLYRPYTSGEWGTGLIVTGYLMTLGGAALLIFWAWWNHSDFMGTRFGQDGPRGALEQAEQTYNDFLEDHADDLEVN